MSDARSAGLQLRAASRDLAETRERLRGWISARLADEASVILSELQAPAGTGVANETLMFDAEWQRAGQVHRGRYVLRLDAPQSMYLDPCFEDHYRVLEALQDLDGVPIPRVHGFEADTSVLGSAFYLMQRIDGRVPSDLPPYNATGFLAEASPAQRHALWSDAVRVLGRLHRIDVARVRFLDQPHHGATGVEQLLNYTIASYRWASQGREQPILEAAAAWLGKHQPAQTITGFAWGDARIANMIFRDARCVAVLDWDLMSLGGPLSDLGWWLLLDHANSVGFGLPRLEGLGGADETIELWEEASGMRADHLDYFVVLAAFRMAVNIMGLSHLLKAQGKLPADTFELEQDNYGTHYLAQMLDLPLPGPAKFVWKGLVR